MTNVEKYLKDKVDVDDLTNRFEDWHKSHSNVVSYGEALFRFLQAKVKPVLTEDEEIILKGVNKKHYTVIGRDKSNNLYFSHSNNSYFKLFVNSIFGHLFQFIKKRGRIRD